ncbi:hypothetical protein H2248_002074 [Termitomyces sp. 'cryptogamus']|nr:hypothetical protein H2248_002074 [Termitomyces sp. 'cryptogamus']
MTPFRSLGLVLLCTLFSGVFARSEFHSKIIGHAATYNKVFHDRLLKQLADARASTSLSSSSSQSTAINIGPILLDNGVNALVVDDMMNTLQIYTEDNLPTDPVPSSACATALVAGVPVIQPYP